MRALAGTIALLLFGPGCGLLLGVEDWEEPQHPSADGGASSSSSSSGGGGTGGAGGSEPAAGGCNPVDPVNPDCADCVKNGEGPGESDVDCGGDACGPCAEGKACRVDGDCISANCDGRVCGPPLAPSCDAEDPENPSCNDCTVNGLETDVDCGGDSCKPCAPDQACDFDFDCASLVCVTATHTCQ